MNYPYYAPSTNGQSPMVGNNQSFSRPMYVEQPQNGIKGRPVSSIEEVRATSIDFDGSIFFFPDLANKKIYTKQINLDGTSTLNTYEFVAPIDPLPQTYVTREEFQAAIAALNDLLETKKEAPKSQETPKPVINF